MKICNVVIILISIASRAVFAEDSLLSTYAEKTIKRVEANLLKARHTYELEAHRAVERSIRDLEKAKKTETKKGNFDSALAITLLLEELRTGTFLANFEENHFSETLQFDLDEISICCSGLRDGHPNQLVDGIKGELGNGVWYGSSGWVKADLGGKRRVKGVRIYPNNEGSAICTPSLFEVYAAKKDSLFKKNQVNPALGSLMETDPGGDYAFIQEFRDKVKSSAKNGTDFYFNKHVDARFLKFVFREELQNNVGLRSRMTLSEIEFIY